MPRKSSKPTSQSSKKHTAVPPSVAAKTPKKTVTVSPTVEAVAVAAAAPQTAVAVVEAPPAPAAATPAPSVEAEIAALHDASAEIARDAAIAIGVAGNAAGVEPLIAVVRNADGFFHSVVRAAALESLGRLRDARAVDALIEALGDEMAEASAEAVRALASIGNARAVEPLIAVSRNRSGFYLPVVRRAAVIALRTLGGDEANAELLAVASDDNEDPVVRQAAIDAKA